MPLTIQNIRAKADERRLRNEGRMSIVSNTGIEANINFLSGDANSLEGEVKTTDGKVLHRLVGNWDRGVGRSVPH